MTWACSPCDNAAYCYDAPTLRALWPRLHAGDAQPLPAEEAVLQAWALFHAGDFERAVRAGLDAGGGGITVANKAQAIYANYLERDERAKLGLLLEVARRAQAQQEQEPLNPNAHFLQAYALGRYAQGTRVEAAIAEGLGGTVKAALEETIRLAPRHADAHVALGTFHAEVVDKLGAQAGRSLGADADAGLALFEQALQLNPASAIARIEYANALVMLRGEDALAQADALYAQAANCVPLDARERLDVEFARAELRE
ncbi:MAG TPA: hypothetical protein VN680_18575 [Burkholderiaceae bacterium]|jgi:hypothetical protein|nr:hypothetical protein [Burkholderiaceae bacterium]